MKKGEMPLVTEFTDRVAQNVETVIVGKREQIELLMVALLCKGHVLLEDVPGTGKTMLARATAASMGVLFKRLQCTPDLQPNDITGVSVFNQMTNQFEFRPGPVFVNILLADEPEEFAVSVVRLLEDRDLQSEMRSAGRRWVEQQYDWKTVYAAWDGIYDRLLKLQDG